MLKIEQHCSDTIGARTYLFCITILSLGYPGCPVLELDPPLFRGLEDDSMNARNVGRSSPPPLSPGTTAEDVEEDLLDPAVGRVVQGGPTVPRGQLRVGPVAHHELDKVEVPGHAESLEGGLADRVVLVDVDGVAGGAEEALQLGVVALLNQPLEPLLEHGAGLAAVR